MIVAVALMALLLVIIPRTSVAKQWAFCRDTAAKYAISEAAERHEMARIEQEIAKGSLVENTLAWRELDHRRKWIKYYAEQSRRFERAAIRSWLSIDFAPAP